jgi:hypothetical protein
MVILLIGLKQKIFKKCQPSLILGADGMFQDYINCKKKGYASESYYHIESISESE